VTEPVILAFDTSAAHCAAALLRGGWFERVEPMATGQAERLMPMLEAVLADGGIGWRDLTGIGVGTGPGNFTGVRIAVAAARGLALGLGIPAVGVTGLRALAFNMAGPIRVAIAAPRGAFYHQDFDGETAVSEPWYSEAADWPAPGGPIPVGNWPDPPPDRPDLWVARPDVGSPVLAVARIVAAGWGQPHSRPAPFYLRGADAAPPSDPPPVILP
jgi:tRNA threonylcarbamoyl adenosine modification protein YeaZ